MLVRGNIGDKVYVKATIDMIQVTEDGVSYFVKVGNAGDYQEFNEDEVIFNDAAGKIETPEDTTAVIPQNAKKRGRPKKTTVADLARKAEKVRGELECS